MAESSTSTVENKSTKDSTMGNGKQGHAPTSHSKLTTDHGNTSIADTVVAKIAGLAAREIPGVQAMGGGMSRKMGQLRSLVPGNGDGLSRGVSVEVGEREAAVDLDLVTWYGQSIVEVSDAVRSNVIERIEAMTGLKTVEVNINVDDVHVQGDDDDDDDDSESRVQ
ncbi:putative alkaline shock family protein YloU [Stackebrandtia endophytica]|uniref:Putative alkaline shock family protein YloU n=1 Tax=Stackebrandtia endophytica TaxID=1496996 RepID=A0A543AUX3_9ACTN|nr:Asp23/Gls24 family envelope stress response protein [Stackebrandtia endophytica]TQL76354.1 putative alkaline shock family protein YloU [Stackebrandtia endophytica]